MATWDEGLAVLAAVLDRLEGEERSPALSQARDDSIEAAAAKDRSVLAGRRQVVAVLAHRRRANSEPRLLRSIAKHLLTTKHIYVQYWVRSYLKPS